jgi:putative ABC transport system permease protein
MRPMDFGREALSDLRAAKLRSLLTGLGVIIGVGSVTLLLSLGEGVRAQVGATFADLGTTRLVVSPAGSGFGPSASTITLEDADAVAQLPGVLDVAPTLALPLLAEAPDAGDPDDPDEPVTMAVIGTVPQYFDIASDEFEAGLPFAAPDEAVLNVSAIEALYGEGTPPAEVLGRQVELGGEPHRIVGVIADIELGGAGFGPGGGQPRLGTAWVRLEPFMERTGQQFVGQLNLRAVDTQQVEAVREAVRDLFLERHGVRDVQVISLARLLDRVNEALAVITGFLAALAGISLLVGGIGIMNIMLAVVAERTREIGIIRALGATRAAVVGQFLAEAVFISLLGGMIGLALALLGTVAIEQAMDVPAIVSPWIVVLALGVSTLIGVLFGVLPAWRAARLDPIRALRHD